MQNLASSMLYYIQWYIGIKRRPKWPFHYLVFDAALLKAALDASSRHQAEIEKYG